ncbi:MAG TPA: hypothetical protein VMV87_15695 [Burkholderiales bacterium]|nr:hypothetical protein [Burkholderiales bacterium]
MFNLQVGQELEFIEPATAGDLVIPKGTRVRVGAIMSEVLESKVTLIVHGGILPETLNVERHIVTLHCRPLP